MNVLVLGKIGSPLTPIIRASGCDVIESTSTIDVEFLQENHIGYSVVYGYRHIIKKPVIDHLNGKIINLHISLLPWNRGADPNLWSFLEDTPKGVTIHYIDEGLDTGDILASNELFFDEGCETLASSYKKLNDAMIDLFSHLWPDILLGKLPGQKQPPGGTFHLLKDKKRYEHLLSAKGWETPVKELVGKAVTNNG